MTHDPRAALELPDAGLTPRELARENEKLRKIVKVLVDRVERSTDAQGNAFSLFQAAITLENTVRQRTGELQSLNRKLQQEVEGHRATEAALERAKVQAERANLSKTEFLSAASHDLLQPLNVARLILNALGDLPHDPQTAAMLERVHRSLEGAESLLATLLEMSRIDAGALEPDIADVALDPLLRRLSDEYSLKAEECELRLRVVPCDAVVRTDIRLLERILRNFLSNALRYTARGGVLVGCRYRAAQLRIEVWDTGPGIPPDRFEDIFKEFHRLDAPAARPGGMGLGLAIVDRLARLLNAHVSVRSREGRGSVFRIDLPLGDEARARVAAAETQRRASSLLFGKSVLVIDQDRKQAEELALHLRNWGLVTLEAQSVEGAVAGADAHGRIPSAVLIDDSAIDGTSARAAIEQLRARFGDAIPAVLLTADATESPSTAEGGFWYLSKPVRVERLRSLLNHLLTTADGIAPVTI